LLSKSEVVDNLITSGATMRLSLQALHEAGIAAWGFAYAGC
jgi:predicted amidophosphoribosyltransferase